MVVRGISRKLDNLDMQILSKLLNNCRESDRQIGMEIGISGSAVKSRISKLEKLNVIESYTLKIEPPTLGCGIFYIVASGRNIKEILSQTKLVGEPFLIVPCIGGITVCGIVVKENVQQKIELAKNLMKDVRVLSIFEAENPGINPDITKTDLQIISELIKNPKEKIEKIAKATKLSTKTVTRSIDKMQKDEAIQFTLVYEPTKITGFIPYAVLTWIKENMQKTLKILEKSFGNNFLQFPFIAKNQIVLFMYSDNIFKIDELTEKIRNVSCVDSVDLFIPKKILFPQEWILNEIKIAKNSPKLHLAYQTH